MLHKHVPAQQPCAVPCPLAFVDEAPGDTEICLGKALVGPQGQEFNRMLRLAGIDRAQCLITHLSDTQFPGDDVRSICTKEPEDAQCLRAPSGGWLPVAFMQQLDRLRAELEAAQPAVIVSMGSLALWVFTGVSNITDMRGAVSRATAIVSGTKILPTFRPGYVLRQYKMRGTVIADLRKAMAEAQRPAAVTKQSKRELWIAPSITEIRNFRDTYLRPSPLISVDIETAKGQITCVGFGASANRAISVPFVDYRVPSRSYWETLEEEMEAWKLVQEILALPNPKLFQNGPYDTFYFVRYGLHVVNWCEDTRLLHHALYPELPKSLAYMGSVYTHESPWKRMGASLRSKRDG